MILLLLLAVPVFAQDVCDQDTDPLVNQCYVDACAAQKNNRAFPLDEKEFAKQVTKTKISSSQEELRQFERDVDLVSLAKNQRFEFVQKKGALIIADELMGPSQNVLKNLDPILSRRFTIASTPDGERSIIYSDLEDELEKTISRRVGGAYLEALEIKDGYYSFISGTLDLEAQNKFLMKVAKDLLHLEGQETKRGGVLKAFVEELASNPRKKRGPGEVNRYFSLSDVDTLINQKVAPLKKDVAHIISRQQSSWKKGLPYKDVVTNSCRIASFMVSRVKDRDLFREFEAARESAMKGLQEKFLKDSCPEIASVISQRLHAPVFKSIGLNKNYLPDFKAFEKDMERFSKMEDSKTYVEYLEFEEKNRDALICDVSTFFPTDNFDGDVNVSLFTLAMGYHNIITHELGHWVSGVLKQANLSSACGGKFAKLRSCLSGFYVEKGQDLYGIHPGDQQRTEEDFADWFAALVTSDGVNPYCDADKITKLALGYIGEGKRKKTNLFVPNSDDTHSSDLFRVLHTKILRNESLSKSCENLLKKYPDSAPKKCEF